MKKRFFAAAFIAAVFSVSTFALEAKVISVTGKVEIREGRKWIPLAKGESVEKGAVISTGYKSEAVLQVKGASFTLGAMTRVTVEDLVSSSTKDTTQLYIDSGSISADVNQNDGKRVGFKVRSPVATASVRGTSFKMNASGKLIVTKGLVSFSPSESDKAEVNTESKDSAEAPVAAAPAVSESAAESAPKSTAFTSAAEVGGTDGVPVAAGQVSQTNIATGSQSKPQAEKVKASAGAGSSTKSLAEKEAATTSSSAPVSAPSALTEVSGVKTGSIIFNLSIE